MSTEDEIGQTFDQAIRTAIMTGSQAIQAAAQRQQTRTMNAHREQQAVESVAREAERRRERYRDEQVSVIYSKVEKRDFWSQHEIGQIVDYTAYVAEHRKDSPRAQAAFEKLNAGFKELYRVDVTQIMAFDQLKLRNDIFNAIDDAITHRRENTLPEGAAMGSVWIDPGSRPSALQAEAKDIERYVEALNEHLGERTQGVLREQAWPALVNELRSAEEAGHDVSNLVREITSEYGRGLDDARDTAAVLQSRAAHQQAERTPERTPERTADANTAPGTTAAAEKPAARFRVYEFRNESDSSREVTRDYAIGIVASTAADAEYDSRGALGNIKGFKGKDPAIDWAIATKFPGLMTDEEREAVSAQVANETPQEREQRVAVAERLARVDAERSWWDGLSPAEREAQHEVRDEPIWGPTQVRKQIEWDSPEWQERVDAVMKTYGLDSNKNQSTAAVIPIAPQELPGRAAAALAESRLAFPKEVPAELDKWTKEQRAPKAPKRARQHQVSTGRDQERELGR